MQLSLRAVNVLTSVGIAAGCLVLVDGGLVAVFVHLELDLYGRDRGRWNLEAGFGPCDMRAREPFVALLHAVGWVAAQVGAAPSSAMEAVAAFSSGVDAGELD